MLIYVFKILGQQISTKKKKKNVCLCVCVSPREQLMA